MSASSPEICSPVLAARPGHTMTIDAGVADEQADEPVERDRLVVEGQRREDDHDQRHGAVDDRGDGRVDRPLGAVVISVNGMTMLIARHHDEVDVDPRVARQRLARDERRRSPAAPRPMASRVAIRVNVGSVSTPSLMNA